jgi:hypothetical protein
MVVVYEDVRFESLGGAVSEAVGSVGGVSEHKDVVGRVELEVGREDVGEQEGEEEQALGELQSHTCYKRETMGQLRASYLVPLIVVLQNGFVVWVTDWRPMIQLHWGCMSHPLGIV